MRINRQYLYHLLRYFNSKRCDYETALFVPRKNYTYFNSKRCDYELCELNYKVANCPISIPKGAIMRTKIEVYIVDKFDISIPKGAIMRTIAINSQ